MFTIIINSNVRQALTGATAMQSRRELAVKPSVRSARRCPRHPTFPCEPEDCQQGSLPSMSREAWLTEDDTCRLFTIRDQLSSSVPG